MKTKASRALVGVLILYAALILTHRGEFWPFSVFPMYSKGRESWSRPLIVEIHEPIGSQIWQVTVHQMLAGDTLSLFTEGVRREDLRRIFDTNETWDNEEIVSLRPLVGEQNIRGRRLVMIDVRGELEPDGDVSIRYVPLAVFTDKATRVNPIFLR